MEPTTTIVILIVIAALALYFAVEKVSEKVDDLQVELRRMSEEQEEESRLVRRHLLAIDDKAYAAAEGVADLRVHQENH